MENPSACEVENTVEDLFMSPAEIDLVDQAERYMRKPNGSSDQGYRED